jgi:hypothetical protein
MPSIPLVARRWPSGLNVTPVSRPDAAKVSWTAPVAVSQIETPPRPAAANRDPSELKHIPMIGPRRPVKGSSSRPVVASQTRT